MESWTFVQYNKVVDSFFAKHNIDIDNPDIKKQGNLKPRLGTLLEWGNECGEPISKFLEKGLFELKATVDCKEIRLIYFYRRPPHHRTICFVHAFFKKTQKTGSNDKKIARKNKNLAEKEGRKIHEFNFAN